MEPEELPVEITIRTQLSRSGLLAVRDRIEELLDGLGTASPPHSDPETEEAARVERETLKADASWERLSDSTRQYLVACARLASQRDTFTVEDVVGEMGEKQATVLALHRNVMRTSATAEPQDTPLITSHRSAGRTQLSMSHAVRDRLLRLAEQHQRRE
jgi:hypothetical protein